MREVQADVRRPYERLDLIPLASTRSRPGSRQRATAHFKGLGRLWAADDAGVRVLPPDGRPGGLQDGLERARVLDRVCRVAAAGFGNVDEIMCLVTTAAMSAAAEARVTARTLTNVLPSIAICSWSARVGGHPRAQDARA